MSNLYLTVSVDGLFGLLSYLPNKKYLLPETKIFEVPENVSLNHVYDLINDLKFNEALEMWQIKMASDY